MKRLSRFQEMTFLGRVTFMHHDVHGPPGTPGSKHGNKVITLNYSY